MAILVYLERETWKSQGENTSAFSHDDHYQTMNLVVREKVIWHIKHSTEISVLLLPTSLEAYYLPNSVLKSYA